MAEPLSIIDPSAKNHIPLQPPKKKDEVDLERKVWKKDMDLRDTISNGEVIPVPWKWSRMVITNQSDIDAATEKHGEAKNLPPLPVRTPPPSQAREQNTEEEDQIEEEKNECDLAGINEDEVDQNNNETATQFLPDDSAEHMPDNTELQDHPSNPNRMTDDDLHFVLIEHDDEDGLVRVSTGDDGFERNGVKNDAFHLLQQMKRTWKKNHGFYRVGSGLLRDAILTQKPEQMVDENKKCHQI